MVADNRKQHRQDEARERRQQRVIEAVADFLHSQKAKRPGRAGAGGPLFEKSETRFEELT
jgi:hypothetical protein